jgi:hypothetical protein
MRLIAPPFAEQDTLIRAMHCSRIISAQIVRDRRSSF